MHTSPESKLLVNSGISDNKQSPHIAHATSQNNSSVHTCSESSNTFSSCYDIVNNSTSVDASLNNFVSVCNACIDSPNMLWYKRLGHLPISSCYSYK